MQQVVTITDATGAELAPHGAGARRGLRFAFVQCLILGLALVAIPFVPFLPAELFGMQHYGPFMALLLSGAIALSFNRGRALMAVVLLTLVYSLHARGLLNDPGIRILAMTLLPLNLAGVALLKERGVLSRYALRRLGLITAQVALGTWLVASGTWEWIIGTFHGMVSPLALIALPPLVVAAVGIGLVATAAVLWKRGNAIDAALCASVIACQAGAALIGTQYAFPLTVSAAALGITVGVLQDAFRFAFVDELTGLGGRRALSEKLLTLGDRYTIAMVDVDHFKRVNDVHGHEIGDQVLRMVASHLAATGGGARAYRYGGEEFALVFANRSARDTTNHLERLRRTIESYPVLLRASDRPDDTLPGTARRGQSKPIGVIRITVSIGIAERTHQIRTPEDVLRTADEALYRAKERGRNRLSR